MSIATRLKRLEDGNGGDGCPVCGFGSDGPKEFHFLTDEVSSPFYRETPLPEPDPCAACGRAPLVFTMRIDYASGDEELER